MVVKRQKDTVSVATISITATSDIENNWKEVLKALDHAADHKVDWIQLPEMWSYIGGYEHLPLVAECGLGPKLAALSQFAAERGVVLFAGTVVEKPEQHESVNLKKYFNTLYVFGRSGEVLAKYRKIHLFHLKAEDGFSTHSESDGYLAGSEPTVVEIDGFKVVLSICYDLRFSELYASLLHLQGPFDVIVAPSAFTLETGKAHWELLLRARAVEFQCYVYAANQVGEHGNGKASFGHGMIVDPWGRVLSSTGPEKKTVFGVIERQTIGAVRGRLPALANRRSDVYKFN